MLSSLAAPKDQEKFGLLNLDPSHQIEFASTNRNATSLSNALYPLVAKLVNRKPCRKVMNTRPNILFRPCYNTAQPAPGQVCVPKLQRRHLRVWEEILELRNIRPADQR
jgi:hypothetical protein